MALIGESMGPEGGGGRRGSGQGLKSYLRLILRGDEDEDGGVGNVGEPGGVGALGADLEGALVPHVDGMS